MQHNELLSLIRATFPQAEWDFFPPYETRIYTEDYDKVDMDLLKWIVSQFAGWVVNGGIQLADCYIISVVYPECDCCRP